MPVKLISAIAVLALIAGYFYFQVDWEARAVRKQLNRIVELVEKDGAVSTLEALGRSRKLAGFFTEFASVEYYPGRNLPKDVDSISAAFVAVWGRVDSASIRVLRHQVEIDASEPLAESLLTANCSVILNGSEKMGDTLKYRIYWRKVDGDWLIETMLPTN